MMGNAMDSSDGTSPSIDAAYAGAARALCGSIGERSFTDKNSSVHGSGGDTASGRFGGASTRCPEGAVNVLSNACGIGTAGFATTGASGFGGAGVAAAKCAEAGGPAFVAA
jgi:hypothetical protein